MESDGAARFHFQYLASSSLLPFCSKPAVGTSPIIQNLLARKVSLLVIVSLYDRGNVSTSGLIRELDAHPATVIAALRELECMGIMRRRRQTQGRHEVRAALTLKGMELVETPLYRWGRLIRDWDSTP